jgi:prepilin-type N-terminal cleavage/methylation domain-containing protein
MPIVERMRAHEGFTLIEMVIVIVVGAILVSFTFIGFGSMRGGMAVSSAKGTFLTMHAGARALASERGVSMRLVADSETRIVSIEEGCAGGGNVLQREVLPAAITLKEGTALALCLTPRGFADPSGNSFAGEGYIAFTQGDRTIEFTILPLGQVVVQ